MFLIRSSRDFLLYEHFKDVEEEAERRGEESGHGGQDPGLRPVLLLLLLQPGLGPVLEVVVEPVDVLGQHHVQQVGGHHLGVGHRVVEGLHRVSALWPRHKIDSQVGWAGLPFKAVYCAYGVETSDRD